MTSRRRRRRQITRKRVRSFLLFILFFISTRPFRQLLLFLNLLNPLYIFYPTGYRNGVCCAVEGTETASELVFNGGA